MMNPVVSPRAFFVLAVDIGSWPRRRRAGGGAPGVIQVVAPVGSATSTSELRSVCELFPVGGDRERRLLAKTEIK